MSTADYVHPDVLVSTSWVADHLNDPKVKIVEVDVDTTSYDKGHIKNAIGWNWQTQLQDRVRRDVVDPRTFAELCRNSGINNDDMVVLYGDNNNWFAAWAFWQFQYHGHKNVKLMNGGRKKWEEEKRPLVTEKPQTSKSNYAIPPTDESIRAYRREVEDVVGAGRVNLVDVRSPMSSPARSSLPSRSWAKKACSAAATSPAPRTSPGPRPSTTTAPSRPPPTYASSISPPASTSTSPRSPTAASASARATRGSCCGICWALGT